MPLYIPWLTETIKKRGVRYLLHHYLGQFFEEKLTLEQLSIDIYEGKGSIRNLSLDVNGLNDELDFIPFKFLEGCLIGQISVEVPWSCLATEACTVELDGARFICRLKTSADGSKAHCTESTLLSRSLMTSSMQMAEDIVTTEDDDDYDTPNSSSYHKQPSQLDDTSPVKKDASQMFEGLEMFAQLIDSVLRRTKLTARNTLFQIQPHLERDEEENQDGSDDEKDSSGRQTPDRKSSSATDCNRSTSGSDEFGEALAKSNEQLDPETSSPTSEGTVEFFIKFFRCEEIMSQSGEHSDGQKNPAESSDAEDELKRPLGAMPETITKLLTLEDVEMRIGGIPVSNLIGKHTIMIRFNGQKSEISIFSGSPLLAVIGHKQLKTFFKVFDSPKESNTESSPSGEKNQKVMSPEDYAKIENQLLETAALRNVHGLRINQQPGYMSSNQHGAVSHSGGRRWVDSGDIYSRNSQPYSQHSGRTYIHEEYDYHSPNSSSAATCLDGKMSDTEPTLDSIEAFSCELKLPGIWLCIVRDGETLPPLIKPYADSINSFQTINKYINDHIKVPHIRLLALKVALDITTNGINVFLGDLDISEYLINDSMNPTLHLLQNDSSSTNQMNSSRYKARIVNKEITVDLLTKTRILFDPTMIDRIVYDYKLIKLAKHQDSKRETLSMNNQNLYRRNSTSGSINQHHGTKSQLDLNLIIRGQQFKVEMLCPVPDLTPEAQSKPTQLRPQSFLFDFKNVALTWQSDKLNVSADELLAYVKTQPQQNDNESVKFIEAISKNNDRIVLILEPTPSNLDKEFPNDVEQALNESSLYDSIYVSKTTESRIPIEPFQTKRKVVGTSMQQHHSNLRTASSETKAGNSDTAAGSTSRAPNECDNEKILTPGDRQHLLEYLNQTVMSTKLSLNLHLPICEVEFEDKEQLDLIYNRFANDFVFWQPKAFSKSNAAQGNDEPVSQHQASRFRNHDERSKARMQDNDKQQFSYFKQSMDSSFSETSDNEDRDSEVSFHSLSVDGSSSDSYENELTCKIVVDELFVRFNHQSCAAAMKQEISAENLLLGVVIDVNKKPGTALSLVADNLELSTDSETVLEGNCFGDKNSVLSMTVEIKRPTKSLKDIKLAIQLINGLFNDFKTDTYTRFWQSINVTDEPILGFVAPKIVTELHIDVLSTALSLVREGARPALLSVDELYLTSMVMERTSQVMIRLIADEVSLYLKRNKQGLETIKNYICLVDSGLIDLDVKFSEEGRIEFSVINNVITVRACQDSLSALCNLFKTLVKKDPGSQQQQQQADAEMHANESAPSSRNSPAQPRPPASERVIPGRVSSTSNTGTMMSKETERNLMNNRREQNLLEDAMNDFGETSSEDDVSNDETDSDNPPDLQTAAVQRDPNACLLDESNPLIGADFFSQPLLPSPDKMSSSTDSFNTTSHTIDESGFFVIGGEEDLGAGIMDKMQQEPIVRKLTEGPINIIENHFKMTKPRTIPEILAASLERYVLEEMTLVVNLYGGRDFDDEPTNSSASEMGDTNSTCGAASEDHATDPELLDMADGLSMRSRTGSVASTRHNSLSGRSSLNRNANNSLRRRGGGGRKKHLSEGSRELYSNKAQIEPRVRFGEGAVNLWESLDLMSPSDFFGSRKPSQPPLSSELKMAGGTWRQTDVCIQLTLTKVKLLYEIADSSSPISWRFMLFIHDIEIKDKIHASDINKILYEYCTESMPKRNTQLLTIKNVATINPSDGCEECDLKVSLKPLRLNIDQDTLLFMIEFFTAFGKSLSKQQSVYKGGVAGTTLSRTGSGCSASANKGGRDSATRTRTDSASARDDRELLGRKRRTSEMSSDTSLSYGSTTSLSTNNSTPSTGGQAAITTTRLTNPKSGGDTFDDLPTHCHADNVAGATNQQPIYIKSFTFSPDVPIRLDYHAKHLDFEQGALAGILMGLAHLDHSELVLRRVLAKHGMRGLDRVLVFTLNSWMSDIKRNQLPSILSGVGPMHSVIQLFQGMRDLVWMPIDHYRKDRRLVRGIQRGASSFSSSTAMAAINLMNRFISIVQCTAQIAHDIVTPPSVLASRHHGEFGLNGLDPGIDSPLSGFGGRGVTGGSGSKRHRRRVGPVVAGTSNSATSSSIAALNQPRNFCEGVAVGFTILKEGFNDTARNVAVGMQAEDVRSAMGELVRQIPSTLLNPIISATEGAQNVLVGIRNQIAPDARREDQEKWKRRVRGK